MCFWDSQDSVAAPIRWDSGDCSVGLSTWAQVLEPGSEGLIAKDPESPYRGGHTVKWLKVRQRDYPVEERGWTPGNKSLPPGATLRAWFLLADKDEAYLAEIDADAPVAARVTPVGFAWLPTLPPIHEDLDDPLGFLRRKVLAQKRK
jgi:hypothetical protein